MKLTLSVLKADVGSIGGHTKPSERMLDTVRQAADAGIRSGLDRPVTQWSGFPRNVQPQEHSEIRWFSINEALQLDLALPDYPKLFRTMELRYC